VRDDGAAKVLGKDVQSILMELTFLRGKQPQCGILAMFFCIGQSFFNKCFYLRRGNLFCISGFRSLRKNRQCSNHDDAEQCQRSRLYFNADQCAH